jgi:hypothetical protein
MGFRGAFCKQLTVDDVRQIVRLARSRREISEPVQEIVMNRPDEAEVICYEPHGTAELMPEFKVRKKNGRWMIIEGSIQKNRVIMTG